MNYVYVDHEAAEYPLTCEVSVTTDRDERGTFHDCEIVSIFVGRDELNIMDLMDSRIVQRIQDRADRAWPHGFEYDCGELETM